MALKKTKTENKRAKTHVLIRTEKDLEILFQENRYLEVIFKVKKIENLINEDILDLYYFNNKVSCLIYLGLSYFQLGDYEKAKVSFLKIKQLHNKLMLSRRCWKNLTKLPINKSQSDIAQTAFELLSVQLKYFYQANYCNYLSNLAFTFFKLKKYLLSIVYYKKALKIYYKNFEKESNDKNREIQLNLGIAEAQYYYYRNIYKYKFINTLFCRKLPKQIIENYNKTLNMLRSMKTSFDTLLAMGKMYYFLGEYDFSISYLQKAIEFPSYDKEKYEIYAFDWLSRIAYKTKKHDIAVEYYKKIIDSLIKVQSENPKTIHPRPELHLMFKFLNQNKEATLRHEIHYINKTIWGGIVVATILESAEILSAQPDVCKFVSPISIVIIMCVLVLLFSSIYINIYK